MIARELKRTGDNNDKRKSRTSSSIMGIINNEKYKGDILLGDRHFTVDRSLKKEIGKSWGRR